MYYFNKPQYLTMLSLIFVLFTIQNGCGSKEINPNKIKTEITPTVNQKTKIDSFSITISNGGGFSGLKNGYTFNSTGLVKRWRQISFVKDTIIWKIQTDGIKTNDFENQLVNSGILSKQYNNTGNITFVLTYQIPDTTYFWSWNGKNEEENIPPEIKGWVKDVTDFIISIQQK